MYCIIKKIPGKLELSDLCLSACFVGLVAALWNFLVQSTIFIVDEFFVVVTLISVVASRAKLIDKKSFFLFLLKFKVLQPNCSKKFSVNNFLGFFCFRLNKRLRSAVFGCVWLLENIRFV